MLRWFTILGMAVLVPVAAAAQDTDGVDAGLAEARAYLRISDQLGTAGQITYDEVAAVKAAGYDVVVNLAPANEERNALEGFHVTQEGMTYVQIPVSWEDPSQRDLQLFFDVMNANADRSVLVHCFANMRASAFVYLFRTIHADVSEAEARADMAEIWDPASQPQWGAFVEEAQRRAGSR